MKLKGEKNMLPLGLIFIALVLVVAAIFIDNGDSAKKDEEISEKKNQIQKIQTAIEDLHALHKLNIRDLKDVTENQKMLTSKVGQIEEAQSNLHSKINETEKHLDIRISQMSKPQPQKKPEVISVSIVNPIILERVTSPKAPPAQPVKKVLGRGVEAIIEGNKK